MLPNDHPLAGYNNYFYLKSGTYSMPIYIFKFEKDGVLIELRLNDKQNGPSAKMYSLIFEDEYDFKIAKSMPTIQRRTEEELYTTLNNILNMEVIAHYGDTSENS